MPEGNVSDGLIVFGRPGKVMWRSDKLLGGLGSTVGFDISEPGQDSETAGLPWFLSAGSNVPTPRSTERYANAQGVHCERQSGGW